jgi:hypothetical protein
VRRPRTSSTVPVFKKAAGISILLFAAQVVVSAGAAPVLAGDLEVGVKLAVALGIASLWSLFCVYACKAFEASYLSVMELAAHPPVPVAAEPRLAKAS